MGISSTNISAVNEFAPIGSPRSGESKQIFTDDWQTDGGIFLFLIFLFELFFPFKDKTPGSPNDMNDLDALLKQFEQPTKSTIKENVNIQQQQKSTKQPGGFSFDNSPPQQ